MMGLAGRRMRDVLRLGLVILPVLMLVSGGLGQTTGDDEVIKVETSLVSLPITVFDRNGRYISDLKRENFKVIEDGAEQEVEYFAPVDTPVTVLLLLDCSGSMGENLSSMVQAAGSFMSRLKAEDTVGILTFARDTEEALPLTKLKNFPKNIQIHQRSRVKTRVYNAVDIALRKLENVKGRKAIILFSDGVSEEPETLGKKNMADAEEQEALIYTVRFSESAASSQKSGPMRSFFSSEKPTDDKERKVAAYMTGLAYKTGGRSFRIEAITDLQKTFGDIASELRRQYTIGYYSNKPGPGGQHRDIKVQVNIPGAAVRTRNAVALHRKN